MCVGVGGEIVVAAQVSSACKVIPLSMVRRASDSVLLAGTHERRTLCIKGEGWIFGEGSGAADGNGSVRGANKQGGGGRG